jgi:hypothetical protein
MGPFTLPSLSRRGQAHRPIAAGCIWQAGRQAGSIRSGEDMCTHTCTGVPGASGNGSCIGVTPGENGTWCRLEKKEMEKSNPPHCPKPIPKQHQETLISISVFNDHGPFPQ